jgi:hypothetical protein
MNWGNKLLLAFVVFAAGMAFMVYQAVNTDFELVEKDYYKQELRYQQVIDGKAEAAKLSAAIELEPVQGGIILQLPVEMHGAQPTGEILFYCANDSKKDRRFLLSVDNSGQQFFSTNLLLPGAYKGKISWIVNNKRYYAEKDILIPE